MQTLNAGRWILVGLNVLFFGFSSLGLLGAGMNTDYMPLGDAWLIVVALLAITGCTNVYMIFKSRSTIPHVGMVVLFYLCNVFMIGDLAYGLIIEVIQDLRGFDHIRLDRGFYWAVIVFCIVILFTLMVVSRKLIRGMSAKIEHRS